MVKRHLFGMGSARRASRRPAASSRVNQQFLYLHDAAKSRSLQLRGPNRKSKTLKTSIREQPVSPDDLAAAIRLTNKPEYKLYDHFAGKKRQFTGLANRVRALQRVQGVNRLRAHAYEIPIKREINQLSRRKSLKSFQSLEDITAAIPIFFLIASKKVELLRFQKEHAKKNRHIEELLSKLLGNRDVELNRIVNSEDFIARELSFWEQRLTNLSGAGSDTKAYRVYRKKGEVLRKNFNDLNRRINKLAESAKPASEMASKWLVAGLNFYANEVDRLTYELKILHKLGIHFMGRSEKKITADINYAKKMVKQFRSKI